MSFAEYIYTVVLKPKALKAMANAALLRIIPETVEIGPAILYLDLADPVISGAITLGVYERSELTFLQKHCHSDMTMVDIGANVGLYTILAMHRMDTNGRIIAIEPHPQTYTFLQKNIAANEARAKACPRVDALNLAATSHRGQHKLHINPENRGDNRLYQGTYQGRVEEWSTLPVEGYPVDDMLAELGIHEVNFVKADIQGYEQNAVSGFKKILSRSKNVILMSEFWPSGLKEAGGSATEYLEMLSCLGFTLYELNEKPLGTITPLNDWDRLIARLPGRKYMNIIGVKGYDLSKDAEPRK